MRNNENVQIVEIGKELPPEHIFNKHYAHRLETSNILCRPLPGIEVMKSSWRKEDPNWIIKPYCLIHGEQVLGSFWATMANPNGKAFAWNRDSLEFDIFIEEQHRRNGLGTIAMKHLAQLARAHGKTKLETSCGTNEGELFCRHFGAKILFEDNQRFMALRDFDVSKLKLMTTLEPEKAGSVTIEFHKQWSGQDKTQISKFYGYLSDEANDIENSEKEELSEHEIMDDEDFNNALVKNGGYPILCLARESNGTILGISEIAVFGHNLKHASQGLTGVRKEYRGRGLGKALKASMMLHLIENYPQIETTGSHNSVKNIGINRINDELGFKVTRKVFRFCFMLEKLFRS